MAKDKKEKRDTLLSGFKKVNSFWHNITVPFEKKLPSKRRTVLREKPV